MFWSYLCRISDSQIKLLTFESGNDLEKLKQGYCELILDKFFTSFAQDFDFIFISKYSPTDNPYTKEKEFVINFEDYEKIKELMNHNA